MRCVYLPFLLVFSLTTVVARGLAQGEGTAVKTDTIFVRQVEHYATESFCYPYMSDSVDPSGKAFNPNDYLGKVGFVGKQGRTGKYCKADAEGFFSYPVAKASSPRGLLINTFVVRLNSPAYEKGKILIESTLPFRAFLGNTLVAQSDTYARRDSIQQPVEAPLVLTSALHEFRIRLIDSIRTSDAVADPVFRLRFVPDRANSAVTISTDEVAFVNLDFMMNGDRLGRVALSPSGRYLLLSRHTRIEDKSETLNVLYRGRKEIGRLPALGDVAWLPTEDKLYYSRKRDNGRELVAFDPETLNERIICLSIPEGQFTVSPSGNFLVYTDYKTGPEKGTEVTRVLNRDDRQSDSRYRYFLSLFDLRSGIHRPVTFGYRSTLFQDMSRDDRRMIFAVSYPTTVHPFSNTHYIELNLETMEVDTLLASTSQVTSVCYTSKPDYLLVKGSADAFGEIGRNLPSGMMSNWYDGQLYLYNKKTKTAKALTRTFDPAIENVVADETRFVAYFTAEDKDRVSLYVCDLETAAIRKLSSKEDVVGSFGISHNGRGIAYVGQSISNSDRLYFLSGDKGREELLYDLSASKLEGFKLGKTADWDHTMPNGDLVQGRYYLPPNFDPTKKYPLIVYYYGGTSPVSRRFEGSYSFHMYAAQGYVVYVLNPSGATGFGQEYAARHVGAWGKRTADEIVASVKGFCAQHPFVDSKKIGCMGASYGGFMTQYLQTITDIFAAAVSHAGISSISSYWGEGFWGASYSTVASGKSYPWNDPELYTKQSPLFNADKINTPLLLLHGTADTNVPDGESVQMYNALKILGKEVEFVRIHDQDHFIQDRSKRIYWTNTIFAWFAKWLKDDPTYWNDIYPEPKL